MLHELGIGTLLGKFIRVFLDVFCIYSSHVNHLEKLRIAFKSIDDAKGCLNPTKCCLARKKVSFLGNIISKEGIEMDPEKIHAILALPPPSNVRDVRGVLDKKSIICHKSRGGRTCSSCCVKYT